MCLFANCVSSLEKCPFKLFAHFSVGWFNFLLISCRIHLFILDIKPLPDTWFPNVFSSYVDGLFTFLIIPFDEQMFIILMKSNLTVFPFVAHGGGIMSKIPLCNLLSILQYEPYALEKNVYYAVVG